MIFMQKKLLKQYYMTLVLVNKIQLTAVQHSEEQQTNQI